MTLSAPIHRLKRAARDQARAQSIALHAALDQVAAGEGFKSWSHLSARADGLSEICRKLLAKLRPGDMALIAARPQQGKTMLATCLALAAIDTGRKAHIFSLEDTPTMIEQRIARLPETLSRHATSLSIDCSDTISADQIIAVLAKAPAGTTAVIDYLQLLDQRRTNPPLPRQVETLAQFARDRGITFVFISQLDRRFDPEGAVEPGYADIRLPNPLDLTLFNTTWFLHAGRLITASATR